MQKFKKIDFSNEDRKNFEKLTSLTIDYQHIKYKDFVFSVGDFLLINDISDDYSIGKLVKIIPRNGLNDLAYWPCIRVQWFYRKKDIDVKTNSLDNKKLNSISEFEVFYSEHCDNIFLESVIRKAFVLSFNDYENLSEIKGDVFFCRYGYNPKTKFLIPKYEKWEKACECKLPLNPDQLYIRCEKCDGWFHPECVGFDVDDNNSDISFVCKTCIS